MCPLFKNKYRIGSTRLAGYDYSSAGRYFITICTKNKIQYFGSIEHSKMILSDLGMYLRNELIKTPEIRKDMAIEIDEYVIMPDHFHAIIFIGRNRYNTFKIPYDRGNTMHGVSTPMARNITMHGVSTKTKTTPLGRRIAMHGDSTKTKTTPLGRRIAMHGDSSNKFGPQSKNLSSIIRGIKSVVTTYSKKTNQDFAWQPNYHDRIIRSNFELQCIRKYIRMNPEKWTN